MNGSRYPAIDCFLQAVTKLLANIEWDDERTYSLSVQVENVTGRNL